MSSLAERIPGLQQHRSQVRAPRYDQSDAQQMVDRVLAWIAKVPEDLLAWLQANDPKQFERVMSPWRQIDICGHNRDLQGVRNSCDAMVVAMQQGLRMYNRAPVEESQLELV